MKESTGRSWFFEHKNDMWRAANWVIDRPTLTSTPDNQLDFLMNDLAIRELLSSYTDAFDSKDLALTLAHFTEDCVLVNPRTTFIGKREVQEFYSNAMAGMGVSFHRVQNVVVRPGDEPGEGWVSAYFHAPFIGPLTAMAISQLGRYFGRVVLEESTWRFADLRISVDFMPGYVHGAAG